MGPHIGFVGQDDDADILGWARGRQKSRSSAHRHHARRCCHSAFEIIPAQGVEQLVVERHLWHAGKGEILGRDDAASFEGAVAELQADPARHVLDVGVDVAGPGQVIREDRRERHLDRAFRRPAMTVRMIGRGFDSFGRVGRVLHAEGIEQFLLKDRIPIRSTCGFGHDAARQQMRDVGVGEGRAETGHRLDVAQGSGSMPSR